MAEHSVSIKPEEGKTCNICIYCDSPVPALKSCVMCEASLCENHLRVQSKSAEHILSDPTANLENRKCSIHKKVLDHSCPEGTAGICGTCRLDGENRGCQDNIIKEMAEEKDKLENVLENMSLKKKETEKRGLSVQECRGVMQESTAGKAQRVTIPFTKMIKQLKNKILYGTYWPQEQIPLSDHIQQLGIKKDELSRKIRPTEEQYIMIDPVTVLQERDILDQDNETPHSNLTDIMSKGMNIQKASNMLLDINTAGNNVLLTSDLKSALWSVVSQCYPKTKKRFKDPQVLSISSFCKGKHYWKVETSKSGNWRVGMCYRSIARKGFGSYIGCNNKSWGLCKWNDQYSVMYNCKEIQLSERVTCQKLGIYLDYDAGKLSFYELCDPIRHLHTFTATFTEPLHAAFRIWLDSLGAAWIVLRS